MFKNLDTVPLEIGELEDISKLWRDTISCVFEKASYGHSNGDTLYFNEDIRGRRTYDVFSFSFFIIQATDGKHLYTKTENQKKKD